MTYTQLYLIVFTAINIFLFSYADYRGTPESTASLKGILRHSLDLKCEYTGFDDNGGFIEWYRDNETVNSEKPGHYVVKTTDKESVLTIKIFVAADAKVTKWYVKTNKAGNEKPRECQFGQIPLTSSPQGFETNRPKEELDGPDGSIRRVEEEALTLVCIIEPELDLEKRDYNVHWQFSADKQTFSDLPAGVLPQGDRIKIDNVKKSHRGYYRCTLHGFSFTALLRVKDRLAALWPFIGIVGIVLVLIIVILIFEKRQKTTRKTNITDEDENDHTNDPLVRPSDNGSKKRAVKA